MLPANHICLLALLPLCFDWRPGTQTWNLMTFRSGTAARLVGGLAAGGCFWVNCPTCGPPRKYLSCTGSTERCIEVSRGFALFLPSHEGSNEFMMGLWSSLWPATDQGSWAAFQGGSQTWHNNPLNYCKRWATSGTIWTENCSVSWRSFEQNCRKAICCRS